MSQLLGCLVTAFQYKFTEPWIMELGLGNTKWIMAGTYTRQELIDHIEGKIEKFDKDF